MITLGIAILLTAGLAVSKICQKMRLPSVTGYILAGLLLGPTGLGFITETSVGHSLDHFTQIALMLIAFGIGEHIELKKLRAHASSLFWIGLFEASGPFLLVSSAILLTLRLTGLNADTWTFKDHLSIAMLLGSISVATAPAATLLVIRELKAKGPLTSTLMALVAIDDGLAVMVFGLVVSATHQFLGKSGAPIWLSVFSSLMEITGSLLLGILTGIVLVLVLSRLRESGELMTAGLAILLLCGEVAVFLHLSPLLAGMAAGFHLVNKAERDVRVFRALNRFEPPIYVLFFTLAGTHLDIASLTAAGILGFIYFLATASGKIGGISLGARIAGSPPAVRRYLGFAMIPQAGVAIGLIFLLSSDHDLAAYTSVITPVVLTSVFLAEMIGPVGARFALTKAGETASSAPAEAGSASPADEPSGAARCPPTFTIVPWTWQKLSPPSRPRGHVLFHAVDHATVRGLARIATILARHYNALPMALRIVESEKPMPRHLFREEHAEVHSMGYPLVTEVVPGPDFAASLVAAAQCNDAKAVVLGYPLTGTMDSFKRLLETVAPQVQCPVAVVRFCGDLHTERILIPLADIEELAEMFPIITALDSVGEHRLKLLYMMSSTAEEEGIRSKELELHEWLEERGVPLSASVCVIPTESRLQIIFQAADDADIVVMGTREMSGMERFLFGSLTDTLAAKLSKTLIVVYNASKE